MTVCLEFHDIVDNEDFASSGFHDSGADAYKVGASKFRSQMDRIFELGIRCQPVSVCELNKEMPILTFDDGGIGAIRNAAPILNQFNVSGCFLITTGKIGHPGFLSETDIRALVRDGHTIGAHTENHPLQMAALTPPEIEFEWKTSIEKLTKITGRQTQIASISGGQYSRLVAEIAERNGIRVLFTSEPTTRWTRVGRCLVLGRYTIRQSTPTTTVVNIAGGKHWPRYRQWFSWNVRKVAKKLTGKSYLRIRKALLR